MIYDSSQDKRTLQSGQRMLTIFRFLGLCRNLNDLSFYCLCLFQVDLATELEQAKSQIMTHASEIAQVSGFATLEMRKKLGRV